MSDRVAVMRDGEIVQIDTPSALYERPNCTYVANFVGRTNLIEVVLKSREGDDVRVEANGASFSVAGAQSSGFAVGERCLLAARPEHFGIGPKDENALAAKVLDVSYRGSVWNVELSGPRNEPLNAQVRSGDLVPQKGEVVTLSFAPGRCFLLKTERS